MGLERLLAEAHAPFIVVSGTAWVAMASVVGGAIAGLVAMRKYVVRDRDVREQVRSLVPVEEPAQAN